jgi:hypothetical protein
MSRKIVIFVVFMIGALSIMTIAVFGTLPEDANRIRITAIVIDDFDQMNEDQDKFKDVKDKVTLQNNVYEIHYRIEPTNAHHQLQVISSNANVNVQIDTIDQIVYVYFDSQQIGRTVTIRIIDADTQIYDEITLWFKQPGVIDVPDLD